MRTTILIITCLLLFNRPANSQSALEINLGAGFFEGMSVKLKYGNNFQVGLCQGWFGFENPWLTGIEGYYHFSGVSKYNNQHPVYIMTGVSTTIFQSGGYGKFEKIMIYPRIGSTIYFSKVSGLNLDAGLSWLLNDEAEGYYSIRMLSVSIHLFFRV